LLVLAVLPLVGGLPVFLGGHETKAKFASAAGVK
jgi:MFS transporter, ACS family, tartrate transporter